MNNATPSTSPAPSAPRPVFFFARMLVLAQRRFRARQANPATV